MSEILFLQIKSYFFSNQKCFLLFVFLMSEILIFKDESFFFFDSRKTNFLILKKKETFEENKF